MEKEFGRSRDYIGITILEEGDRDGILQTITVTDGEYKDGRNTTPGCPSLHSINEQQHAEYPGVQETREDGDGSKSFCQGLSHLILQRIHLAEERPPEPQQTVEKDGGFCWMVVVGSFFSYFLFAGTRSSMGIVQEELEKTRKEASSELAWTGSLVNSLPLLLGMYMCFMFVLISFESKKKKNNNNITLMYTYLK